MLSKMQTNVEWAWSKMEVASLVMGHFACWYSLYVGLGLLVLETLRRATSYERIYELS